MNPIIKLLAEQAGMNIKTNISGVGLVFGTFEGYKTSHISVEELEKFAKLLVRECKSVLLDMMDESQGDGDTLDLALTEINEHFGVEE